MDSTDSEEESPAPMRPRSGWGGSLMAYAAAVVIGGVYGLLAYYIPFIKLHLFMMFFCGVGVGYATGISLYISGVRRPPKALLTGLIAGLIADYAAFVIWLLLLTGHLFLAPNEIYDVLALLSQGSTWSMYGSQIQIHGSTQVFYWVCEAGIIAVVGGVCAARVIDNSNAAVPRKVYRKGAVRGPIPRR